MNSGQQETDDIDHGLIRHWKSLIKKPKIIVFDLDYTLWPYFVDCHVVPPISIKNNSSTELVDSQGFLMNGFKDVTRILKTLKHHCLNKNEHLAIASRSTTHKLAMETIEALGWKDYFSSFQIYPKPKNVHMKEIISDLKFNDYNEILFFDDEVYNIKTTNKLGVVAIEINPYVGVDVNVVIEGLNIFNSKNLKL